MAHQDYISRSPKKRSENKKKQAEEAVPNTDLKNKIVAGITLFAVLGFAGFLWSLKVSTPAVQETPATVVKEKPVKNTVDLPDPPKEKWSYIEQLKNKEVEVGEYEVIDKGPYRLQCGAFRKVSQAETLKARIAFSGFEAEIRESRGKNGLYHIVVLGPYDKKRLAEKHRHKLKNNNINHCRIWPWT